VGCAAAIINFVDFSCKLVKGSYDIYRSDSGEPAGYVDINTILRDLEDVTKGLRTNVRADSPHREFLIKLTSDCATVSAELTTLLEELKRKQGNKVWRSLEAKWHGIRKEGKLASVEQRLTSLRMQLLLRINLMVGYVGPPGPDECSLTGLQ